MKSSRYVRSSVLVIATLALLGSNSAFAQTWQALAPGTTTENQVLRIYGKPTNVVIRFVGFDDFETWRRNGTVARYDFEYMLGANAIQNGPLGEAHKAVIAFAADKTVWDVQWTYLGGLRLHRTSGESPTRITLGQIERLLGGSPIIRTFAGGQLSIFRFKKDDSIVEVEYSGEGSDIEVHLSRRGMTPLP